MPKQDNNFDSELSKSELSDDALPNGASPEAANELTEDLDTRQLADAEQLTAYLDGELTGQPLADVEQRLLDDADFRNQMQALQTSWDLLDALPKTDDYDAPIHTTLEMVAQAADNDNQARRGLPTWLAIIFGLIAIPAAACWAGYTATHRQNNEPLEQLFVNLPLIENFDRYTYVDLDIEFLEKLESEELFTPEVVSLFPPQDASPQTELDEDINLQPLPETLELRSDRLKSMLPRQLESIQRNRTAFDSLPQARKEALAKFHRELIKHPRRQQLNTTLLSYYDWLKSLGQSARTELLDIADIENRIGNIKQKIEGQNLQAFGKAGATKLPADDAKKVFRWYDELIKKNKQQIRDSAAIVYIDQYKEKFAQAPTAGEVSKVINGPLSQLMTFIFKHDRSLIEPMITVQDISQLKYVLSSEANDILDAGFSVDERNRLIINWIDAANQARFSIDPKTLQGFYDNLADEQRDELDDLSPTDWRNRLIRLYRQYQLDSNSGFDTSQDIYSGG